MTVRMIITALITASVGVSAALAQPAVTGADLLVDLEQFIGKEVILIDAEVFSADNRGALAKSGGATFRISAEGIDRETFREFLKNCSGLGLSAECKRRLLVTPNGEKARDLPILINVKIVR